MTTHSGLFERYRQPLWGQIDRTLRNCFVASGILGLVVLIGVFVIPLPVNETLTIADVPDRIARLILEKPPPAEPAAQAAPAPTVETPPVPKEIKPPPKRRTSKPKVAQDKGTKGRQKAQTEVKQNLAAVTSSLDKSLDDLSKSLKTSTNDTKPKKRPRRRRNVRSGRSSDQLASVKGVSSHASADISTSAIESRGISIAAITDLAVDDAAIESGGAQSSGGSAARSGRGELRSNESLLSVVRRYAPGIQFCYDNELKKNPGLRGKLVVSLTVLANGAVSDVVVVEDSLNSPAVTLCVLSQIRGWQFPEIPQGTTRFKTPFVFTPPN